MSTLTIQLLQNMPIFGAIRDDVLLHLLEQTRKQKVGRDKYFFRQGDSGDSLYVLESGSAVAVKRWRDQELPLGRFTAGDCFGEISLLDLGPRSASVRAEEDCVVFEIGHQDLHRLFSYDTEQFALIQMNISREVCRRLRTAGDMLFRARMGEAVESFDITLRST